MTYPWNAGDILTAADLNAEFGSKVPFSFGTATPTTTTSGFMWYDSNFTPARLRFWNGSAFTPVGQGLQLTAAVPFSAVSAVSLNNCFTTAFTHYRITFDGIGTDTDWVDLRMRVSGSDDSAANYQDQFLNLGDTTLLGVRRTAQTSAQFAVLTASEQCTAFVDIANPRVATKTRFNSTFMGSTTVNIAFSNGLNTSGSSFDGMTLTVRTGTITGSVRVYGYVD
jgi:hypothetical protein